jgi:hypothetical protein
VLGRALFLEVSASNLRGLPTIGADSPGDVDFLLVIPTFALLAAVRTAVATGKLVIQIHDCHFISAILKRNGTSSALQALRMMAARIKGLAQDRNARTSSAA